VTHPPPSGVRYKLDSRACSLAFQRAGRRPVQIHTVRLRFKKHLTSLCRCPGPNEPTCTRPYAGHRFHSALNPYALYRSRITPLPTPCGRAGHGSLRATDRSVVQHLELRTAHGSLRTRHLVRVAVCELLRPRLFALHTAPKFLRDRYLALCAGLRISPYSDTLRPACWSRIAPLPPL
jgi:hypothetical protein